MNTQSQPDIFKDLEAAAEESKLEVDLGLISKLVQRQSILEAPPDTERVSDIYELVSKLGASVNDIEAALKLRKKDLFSVRQVQIPELMAQWRITEIMTEDGKKIEIKDGLSVSVRDKDLLFKWLRSNEAGDLIKNTITVDLAKGKDEIAKEVIEALIELGVEFESKEDVHSATLKKHIKDGLEKGMNVPQDAVNVFQYKYSKLK